MSMPHTSQNSRDEVSRHGFERITAFDEERRVTIPLNALEKIRATAPEFRDRFIQRIYRLASGGAGLDAHVGARECEFRGAGDEEEIMMDKKNLPFQRNL
jgi:hypothetical protein